MDAKFTEWFTCTECGSPLRADASSSAQGNALRNYWRPAWGNAQEWWRKRRRNKDLVEQALMDCKVVVRCVNCTEEYEDIIG